jgi:hypothetical protein
MPWKENCLLQAEDCERDAASAVTPMFRQHLLNVAATWRRLAEEEQPKPTAETKRSRNVSEV